MRLKQLLLVLCVLLPFSPQVSRSDPLKIGYVTDLSGKGNWFGIQTQRGARLAAQELAASGHEVSLIIEDSGELTSAAVSAAIKLLESDKVDALLCDLTPLCSAISPKAKAAHKPLIYHTPSRQIAADNPWALRNFVDYYEGCKALAEEWKREGVSRVGALVPNMEFGELCAAGGMAAFPQMIEQRYNPGDDLRSLLPAFRTKQIEEILMVGYENDHLRWFKLAHEQRLGSRYGFIDVYLTPTFLATGAALLDSALVFGYLPMDQDFTARLNKAFPRPEESNLQGAALAYNAVFALDAAFRECPQRDLSCVMEHLKGPPAQKLLGFLGYGASPAYPMRVSRLKGGVLEPVPEYK